MIAHVPGFLWAIAALVLVAWLVLDTMLGGERIEQARAELGDAPDNHTDDEPADENDPHLDPNVCRCEAVCIPALDLIMWELEVSP